MALQQRKLAALRFRLDTPDEGFVVVDDVSDALADGKGLHVGIREGLEHGEGFFHVGLRVEPRAFEFGFQNHRHAVVKRGEQRVGRASDDGAGAKRGVSGAVPLFPQTGKSPQAVIAEVDVVGGFGFVLLLPLVKTIGGNETTATFEGVFETGFFAEGFDAGVDHFRADGVFLGPLRHQAPAIAFEGAHTVAVRILSDDGNRLHGGNVIARGKLEECLLGREALGDFLGRVLKSESSAHNEKEFKKRAISREKRRLLSSLALILAPL